MFSKDQPSCKTESLWNEFPALDLLQKSLGFSPDGGIGGLARQLLRQSLGLLPLSVRDLCPDVFKGLLAGDE